MVLDSAFSFKKVVYIIQFSLALTDMYHSESTYKLIIYITLYI